MYGQQNIKISVQLFIWTAFYSKKNWARYS